MGPFSQVSFAMRSFPRQTAAVKEMTGLFFLCFNDLLLINEVLPKGVKCYLS